MNAFTTPKAFCTLLLSFCLTGCLAAEEKEENEPVATRGILYRGQVYTLDKVQESELQIEHFAASKELEEQGLLAGFDSLEESTAYLRGASTRNADINSLSCGSYAFFYKYTGYEHLLLNLFVGTQNQRLTGELNDNIASVRTPSCLSTTILYRHSGFGGPTLSLGPNVSANLKDYNIDFWDNWRDDASSIKVVGNLDYSATNTEGATQNTTNFVVNMSAGQTIELGTCGIPSSVGQGDTYLRLFDTSTGAQVTANDDSCGGYLSNISYTATTNGPFEIRAGCWGSASCNGRIGYVVRW